MNERKRIDLHMHSTVSDGTDTPEEILERVKDAGITFFSLTDHDAIKGCLVLRQILTKGDPQFVTGVEFSCRDGEGRYHILGYGYDPEAAPIQGLVKRGHGMRMDKVRTRLELLESIYGFSFPGEEIQSLMVKYGYAKTKDEAMKEYLNKLKVHLGYLSPKEAIAAILASGGIPVLAHPIYGNGDQLILNEDMDRRLRRLTDFGLRGVEAFYSGFTGLMIRQMLRFADQYDLLVTAGSDYHGKNKLIELGDTGIEPGTELPVRMCRFLEEVHISSPIPG